MSTHTPKPWRITLDQFGAPEIRGGQYIVALPVSQEIHTGAPPAAEAEKNLYLMIAAPDLLEALKMLRSQYVLFVGPDDDIATAVLAEVDAAIAAAECSDHAPR